MRASQRSGSAPQSRLFYLFKCTAYVVIGLTVSTLFAGVGNPLNVSNWWAEPIVYQKFLLFAILWELCGLGASSGPAGFHYVPRFGANKYWSKVGVIKRPPFGGRLPGQGGDTRSIVDVAVYYALALSLVVGIVIPPTNHDYVAEYIPGQTAACCQCGRFWFHSFSSCSWGTAASTSSSACATTSTSSRYSSRWF
nr:DUF3556 domain-containing protein [Corynebacterium mycetoides]